MQFTHFSFFHWFGQYFFPSLHFTKQSFLGENVVCLISLHLQPSLRKSRAVFPHGRSHHPGSVSCATRDIESLLVPSLSSSWLNAWSIATFAFTNSCQSYLLKVFYTDNTLSEGRGLAKKGDCKCTGSNFHWLAPSHGLNVFFFVQILIVLHAPDKCPAEE